MKKLLYFALAVILAGCLTSCKLDDSPKKEMHGSSTVSAAESSATVSQKEEETTFGLNESAVFNSLKITATDFSESKGKDFFNPDKGNIFVGIKFTIENISDEEQRVSSLLLFDGYVDDVKSDSSFGAMCVFDEGTLDGTIAPGKKLVGWYAMEVPTDWSTIELIVKPEWLSKTSAKFVFTKQA